MALGGEYEQSVTDAVAKIALRRSAIDQAKGMLMVIYGIDETEAFELLRERSRSTNSSLRAMAEQFRDDVASLGRPESIPSRHVFERLLHTAHDRLRARAAPSAHAHQTQAGP